MSNGIAQLAALLRYVVLARLLGPEQLGLAATLILTAQFADSVTDGGMDRFLIQNRQGNLPRVQALVQFASLLRGAVIAMLLVLLASPLAQFFQASKLEGAFYLLALAPLISGLAHFDYRRVQRSHDFRLEAIVMMCAEVCAFIVTAVAAWVTRDFTAVVYGLWARAIAIVVTTHLVATRRYRARPDPKFIKPLSGFGWPLMLNGVVLFVAGQGDRLVVGSQLSVEALGHYSAIMLLIYYPSLTLARFIQTVNMPVLAGSRSALSQLRASLRSFSGLVTLLSLAMAIGFAVLAPLVVPSLFGRQFAQSPLVIVLIGIVQILRFARSWPTVAALANGRSDIVLVNNLVRVFGFVVVLAIAGSLGGIVAVAATFAVCEVAALVIAIVLANRAIGLSAFADFSSLLLLVATLADLTLAVWAIGAGRVSLALVATGVLLVLTAAAMIREKTTIIAAIDKLKQVLSPKRRLGARS